MSFIFFKATAIQIIKGSPDMELPPGYRLTIWKPSLCSVYPRKLGPVYGRRVSLIGWWVLQYLLTRNRTYSRILLIYYEDQLVHFTMLSPRNLRCPFMGHQDAKLGPVWTHENHRGLGLATFATRELVKQFIDQTHMYFWWFCKAENKGSMRVAEKLGFSYSGKGILRTRLGVRLLRYWFISEYSESSVTEIEQ